MIMRKYYILVFLLIFSSCKRNFIPLDSVGVTVMDFKIDEIDYEYLDEHNFINGAIKENNFHINLGVYF